MRYTKVFIIVGLLLFTAIESYSDNGEQFFYQIYDIKYEMKPYPTGPGPTKLFVNVIPHIKCENIVLKIINMDNVIYNGLEEIKLPLLDTNVLFNLDIELQLDTSSMAFCVSNGGQAVAGLHIYLVVEDDTVKSFDGDPRQFISTILRNRETKVITAEERRLAEGGPIDPMGKDTTYHTDGKGNVISQEEYEKRKSKSKKIYAPDEGLPDSAYIWKKSEDGFLYQVKKSELPTREEQKLQRQLENKRKLEETPLTNADQQDILVGDTVYTRARGEYKFHKAVFTNDPSGYYGRIIDSLRAEEDKRIYDLTLDLREPQEFEYVKGLVDSLIPMEEEGFYRTVTTGAVLQRLRANKIKVGIYPEKPYLQESSRSKHKKSINKSESDSSEKEPPPLEKGSWKTPFWDNFEYWPWWSGWEVGDNDYDSGLVYWGLDDYIAHQGDFSAWCAMIGGDGIYYSNYMRSYMNNSYYNYVNLEGLDSAWLSFWVWYETEPYKDYFYCYYSYDCEYWNSIGTSRSGNSNGWIRIIHLIPSDMDRYYFQFYFHSDSINREYDGVNVDDIVLRAFEPGPPNLKFCVPPNWADSVIITHDECIDSSSYPLYSDRTAHIKWGVINDGDLSTETYFNAALYIDDNLITKIWHPFLDANEMDDFWGSYATTFSPGEHTIKIFLDCDSMITEEDEDDNIFIKKYTFIEGKPNITYNTPAGWNAPLLISANRYYRRDETVYAGDTVFIHWSVINSGNQQAGISKTRLKVDNVTIAEFDVPELDPGEEYRKEEYPILIADSGSHNIAIEHDYNNWVIELDEQDNNYYKTYYWHAPYITASGVIRYKELTAFGLIFP